MSDFRSQPMTATHTPWEAQAYDESESGIAIIGLRTNEDGTAYPSPTNGIVAWVALRPTEIDAKDPTRALATAALIVNAVNSHASLKEQVTWWEEQGRQHVNRIQDLEASLQVAQELFAIVVNPQDNPNTSVQHLWAQCVEAECKIRDLLKEGAVLVPVRDDGAGRIKELEDALRKISCPHVTDRPLWWQLEARTALLANDLRDALQHIQPKDGAK
jgi:hypothetical protein